jgi:hypothetical protein
MIEDNDKAVKSNAKQFMKEYEALCKKQGFMIQVVPVWIARDDGTYSMKLNASVAELPKEVKE